MSLRERIFYNVTCDSCGCILDDMWWDDNEFEFWALERGWVKIGDKHYCPDCKGEIKEDDESNDQTN